jgi:hypothetical protein
MIICYVWSRDGSGFHGFVSSRNDQGHMNAPSLMSPSSSNNPMMPQDPHDPNHQFLSNLGLELLSSPTSSPSGGFRSSSLLRGLTEPAASGKPLSGFQQYHQQQTMMNQAPGGIRVASQFNNNMPFWNPSPGFGEGEAAASLGKGRQSLGQSRPANSLADKVHSYSFFFFASIGSIVFLN